MIRVTVVTVILTYLVLNHVKYPMIVQDSELLSYVNWFKEQAIKHGVEDLDYSNLIVRFGDTKSNNNEYTMGYCIRLAEHREVVLYRPYFIAASVYTKKALIAHELGHCILNRRHDLRCVEPPGYRENGCELSYSLMFPAINSVDFENHEEYYMKELFENYESREIPSFE